MVKCSIDINYREKNFIKKVVRFKFTKIFDEHLTFILNLEKDKEIERD